MQESDNAVVVGDYKNATLLSLRHAIKKFVHLYVESDRFLKIDELMSLKRACGSFHIS